METDSGCGPAASCLIFLHFYHRCASLGTGNPSPHVCMTVSSHTQTSHRRYQSDFRNASHH